MRSGHIRIISIIAALFFISSFPMQSHADANIGHVYISKKVSSGSQEGSYGKTFSLQEDDYIPIGGKIYLCWDGVFVDTDCTVEARITDPSGEIYNCTALTYKLGTNQFGYITGRPYHMMSTVGEDGDTLYGWHLYSTGITSPSGRYTATLSVEGQEKSISWYMIDTPVSINADPEDLSAQAGESASFQVEASGSNLTYQWYYKDSNSTEGEIEIEGATLPIYTIPDVSYQYNGRFYYCQVSNYSNTQRYEKVTLTTKPARLTVQKKQPIVSAYGSEAVYDGTDHGIRVQVSGPADYTVYYSTGTVLDQNNYRSGTLTSPVRRAEGTTTVYYYVHDNQEVYEDVAGSAGITILKNSEETGTISTEDGKSTNPSSKKPGLKKTGKLLTVKSAKKGQMKIKWKKLSGITGYQVFISRNKKFTSHTLKKNFKKSKTSITTNKWPSGRTLYVKLRPYKKKNKKTLFGYWSKVKKVKIR